MVATDTAAGPDAVDAIAGRVAAGAAGRRSLQRALAAVGVLVAGGAALATAAASRAPAFYLDRLVVERAEEGARRLLSDVAALRDAVVREGDWEGALSEEEINAWFAVDLPRNHATLLPAAVSQPRLRFSPRHVHAAARFSAGICSAVGSITAEVRLREPNQLGIVVVDAGLGRLPLPRGVVLGGLRRRLDRLGLVTAIRRLDGRSVLVVYIPSTHESGGTSHRLESLSLGDGSVAFAGSTRVGRAAAVEAEDRP